MAKPFPPLVDSIIDLVSPLGEIRVKRMFGGYGFYMNELFFGLVAFDKFFLKVDDESRATFEFADGRVGSMSYHEAPEEAFSSANRMKPWAMLAIKAAERALMAKKPKAKKKKAD